MPQLLALNSRPASRIQLLLALAAVTVPTMSGVSRAAVFTWDNSAGTSQWSTATNWAGNVEPDATANVIFPTGFPVNVTLSNGETASRLQFDGSYMLSGGSLTLGAVDEIEVAAGALASINTPLTIGNAMTKNGTGTLILTGSNSNPSGFTVAAGTLRIANTLGLHQDSTSQPTTINGGASLELAAISITQRLTLMNGATLGARGLGTTRNITTIDAAATTVNLTTFASGDRLDLGDSSNELAGGSASTVVSVSGPGTVRINEGNGYDGSWSIGSGSRVELGRATSLGDNSLAGVTLAGGTLVGRSGSSLNFGVSPGNHLAITGNSGIVADSIGSVSTINYQFGTVTMGSQSLAVSGGASVSDGGRIDLAKTELGGDPSFDVQGTTTLAIGAVTGGATPRQISKTGSGNLWVTGGSSDLAAGSGFSASGGGSISLRYPALGAGATVVTTAAQNPFGNASLSINGGVLQLSPAIGTTSGVQTYVLPGALSVAGDVTLDTSLPGNGIPLYKTYEFPSLSMAGGSTLRVSSSNANRLRISGSLVLQGDATLRGAATPGTSSTLTLAGGIQGNGALTIGTSVVPFTLAVNASSSRSGSTLIQDGDITLNAANAFGTGPLTLSGGMLTATVPGAIPGNITLTAGTLYSTVDDGVSGNVLLQGGVVEVRDTDAFDGTAFQLNGGTLDLRSESSATFQTGGVSVSGNSMIRPSNLIGGGTSGTERILTLPLITGAPNSTLNILPGGNYVLQIDELLINGDFAVSLPMGSTGRVQTVSEGPGGPWTLTKLGGGTLQLAGPTLRAGNTVVEGGTLQVRDSGALGGGTLVLGNVASTAAATASFDNGLTIPNAITTSLPPAGGGTVKLASPTGGVTWTGPVLAQRELTVETGVVSGIATISGKIEGSGLITKTGLGEIVLSHPANEFTGGLKIQSGYIGVGQDGSLGSSSVPVQLAGGYLMILEDFSSNRTLALSGAANSGVAVAADREFTFGGQITGSSKFTKTGIGTMTFLPGVDNSARGNATTTVEYGSLRIQGLNNLSANGPIQVSGYLPHNELGKAEFLADADTVYPYPVIASGGIIHVDRSLTGSTVNGRHTLGPVTFSTNSYMRVTGDHGYGLSLGHVSALSGGTIENRAEAPLLIDSVEGRSSVLGFGSGDIRILGGLTKQAGGDNFYLRLNDARLKLGTSTAGFSGPVWLEYESVLDTNNLSLNATSVFFQGNWEAVEPPTVGSRIEMGSGTLNLLSGGIYLYSQAMPGQVTGHVDLGNTTRNFISAPSDSGGGVNQPGDAILTVDGPISGSGTAGITKTGGSVLRMTGAGNTFPGALKVNAGEVQLGKSSGLAVGGGGLQVDMVSGAFGAGVTLLADEQIEDSVPLSLSGISPNPDLYYLPRNAFIDLGDHTETVGPLSVSFSGGRGSSQIKIGPDGKLVLNGNLNFTNNVIAPTGGLDVAISGEGTLDLGGVVRTIDVSTTAPGGPEKDQKNAVIEAKVVNGGIIKTGKQTLFLTNPANQFPLGIVVQEGFIGPGAAGSLGSSPVTFTNGPGVLAGYDFGMATGVLAGNLTIAGASDTEIRHSGTGSDAKFTGAITLEKDLVVNVVDGPDNSTEGLLDLAGVISDGSSTFGLIKKGGGILKLGPANAYSGTTTVQGGSLWVTGPGSLGDGNTPLLIDGGSLMAARSSVVLPRDVTFTANGGSLRSTYHGQEDNVWPSLELTGHVDFGSGTTGAFGVAGTTILSGTTAGTGNFLLGERAGAGNTASNSFYSNGHCLSLRGAAALPSGNLQITHHAVLELGNGDFTRALGTGPGEVQIPGSGGWAAYGADRTVDIGGAGASLTWGQVSPRFLSYQEGIYNYTGYLVLGSTTATHTVDFVNPLTVPVNQPTIVTVDGPAAIDARISGDLTLNTGDPEQPVFLGLYGDGTLEVAGDLRGDFDIYQEWEGTTIFRGANEAQEMIVFLAKWIFPTVEGLGSPRYFSIYASEVDVSALPGGLTIHPEGSIDLYGDITGDVTVPAQFFGSGTISGDLSTGAGSLLLPEMYDVLAVGGDFSLVDDATLRFEFPDYLYGNPGPYGLSVGGTVSLQGSLEMAGVGDYFESGETYILIANAGDDPIQGTFENMPEGTIIPMGGGYGMQITYAANGDGGAVANDFGVTVIPLAGSTDGRLTASAPVSVLPGEEIAIRYTLINSGEGATTGTEFEAILPPGLTFIGSQPEGVWNAGTSTFTLALPDQEVGSTEDLVVRFTAPALTLPGTVRVAASYQGSAPEETLPPAQVATVTAVFPGGRPPSPAISHHAEAIPEEQFQIRFETLEGVRYVYEGSMDLQNWYQIGFVEGDGEPYTAPYPYYPEYQSQGFFRFRVVPAVPVEPEE